MLLKNVFKISSLFQKKDYTSFKDSISSTSQSDTQTKSKNNNQNKNNLSYKSIAIVGCGFVADYYIKTLSLHPQLKLVGVMDKIGERANKFA